MDEPAHKIINSLLSSGNGIEVRLYLTNSLDTSSAIGLVIHELFGFVRTGILIEWLTCVLGYSDRS